MENVRSWVFVTYLYTYFLTSTKMTTVLPQKNHCEKCHHYERQQLVITTCLVNEIEDFTLSYSLHNSSPFQCIRLKRKKVKICRKASWDFNTIHYLRSSIINSTLMFHEKIKVQSPVKADMYFMRRNFQFAMRRWS